MSVAVFFIFVARLIGFGFRYQRLSRIPVIVNNPFCFQTNFLIAKNRRCF